MATNLIQAALIQRYHQKLQRKGRYCSENEAAREWIQRFAKRFREHFAARWA